MRQNSGQTRGKTRGGRAVDDPMVVGKRKGQDRTALELAWSQGIASAGPARLHLEFGEAKDRNLGHVHNGRERRTSDPAQA